MQPEQTPFEPDTVSSSDSTFKKHFCQVTPLSKYFALALFIALPFIGGYVGYHFAPEKVVEVEREVAEVSSDVKESEQKDDGVAQKENNSLRPFVNERVNDNFLQYLSESERVTEYLVSLNKEFLFSDLNEVLAFLPGYGDHGGCQNFTGRLYRFNQEENNYEFLTEYEGGNFHLPESASDTSFTAKKEALPCNPLLFSEVGTRLYFVEMFHSRRLTYIDLADEMPTFKELPYYSIAITDPAHVNYVDQPDHLRLVNVKEDGGAWKEGIYLLDLTTLETRLLYNDPKYTYAQPDMFTVVNLKLFTEDVVSFEVWPCTGEELKNCEWENPETVTIDL